MLSAVFCNFHCTCSVDCREMIGGDVTDSDLRSVVCCFISRLIIVILHATVEKILIWILSQTHMYSLLRLPQQCTSSRRLWHSNFLKLFWQGTNLKIRLNEAKLSFSESQNQLRGRVLCLYGWVDLCGTPKNTHGKFLRRQNNSITWKTPSHSNMYEICFFGEKWIRKKLIALWIGTFGYDK